MPNSRSDDARRGRPGDRPPADARPLPRRARGARPSRPTSWSWSSGPPAAGPPAARNAGRRGDRAASWSPSSTPTSSSTPTRSRACAARSPPTRASPPSSAATTTRPPRRGAVSRFRNLLHHHVHASSPGPAETFWAGLGAVRREALRRRRRLRRRALPRGRRSRTSSSACACARAGARDRARPGGPRHAPEALVAALDGAHRPAPRAASRGSRCSSSAASAGRAQPRLAPPAQRGRRASPLVAAALARRPRAAPARRSRRWSRSTRASTPCSRRRGGPRLAARRGRRCTSSTTSTAVAVGRRRRAGHALAGRERAVSAAGARCASAWSAAVGSPSSATCRRSRGSTRSSSSRSPTPIASGATGWRDLVAGVRAYATRGGAARGRRRSTPW